MKANARFSETNHKAKRASEKKNSGKTFKHCLTCFFGPVFCFGLFFENQSQAYSYCAFAYRPRIEASRLGPGSVVVLTPETLAQLSGSTLETSKAIMGGDGYAFL